MSRARSFVLAAIWAAIAARFELMQLAAGIALGWLAVMVWSWGQGHARG